MINVDGKTNRQASSKRLHGLGAILTVLFQTAGLFGLMLWGVSLYGWHQLVFYKLIPNFWLFTAFLVVLFVGTMFLMYKVLYPSLVTFQAHQYSTHNNPMWVELVEIHRILEEIKADIRRKS